MVKLLYSGGRRLKMKKQVLRTCDFQQKNEVKGTTVLRMCAEGNFHSPFSLKRTVAIVGVSALACLFALAFASRYTGTVQATSTIPAAVEVTPNVLNVKSNGNWITVSIKLPDGYNVADIDLGSICLDCYGTGVTLNLSSEVGISNNVLKVKFDRPQISVSQGEAVVLVVSGSLCTGETFEGRTLLYCKC
jgi:hypothetical protein